MYTKCVGKVIRLYAMFCASECINVNIIWLIGETYQITIQYNGLIHFVIEMYVEK